MVIALEAHGRLVGHMEWTEGALLEPYRPIRR